MYNLRNVLRHGKIVVLEGPDGSGKSTQAKILLDRLNRENIPASLFHFPKETGTGYDIRKYLNGLGANELDGYQLQHMFMRDISEALDDIFPKYYEGEILIFDRYYTSGMYQQMGRVPELPICPDFSKENSHIIAVRNDFIQLILNLAEDMHIPVPHLVLYLDTDITICKARLRERENADSFEKDEQYIEGVHKYGLHVADNQKWTIIECNKLKTPECIFEPLSIEEISEKIYKEVTKMI